MSGEMIGSEDGLIENGDGMPKSEPVDMESVIKNFADPVRIQNIDDISSVFEQLKDQPEICISIPVSLIEDTSRQEELKAIGHHLRSAIFKYLGLTKGLAVSEDIEGILGEATSDIGKHSFINEKFNQILVSVKKGSREISIRLANPAKPEVSLQGVDHSASPDNYYDDEYHGRSIAKGLENDLSNEGCSATDDSSIVVDENKESVAVYRKIEITLPE